MRHPSKTEATPAGRPRTRGCLKRAGDALLVRLAAGYVQLVRSTTRWTIKGEANLAQLMAEGRSFIPSMWHGRLFISPTLPPKGRRPVAMISSSHDGDLTVAVVARFGVESVRGSTRDHVKRRDKGGAAAYVGAIKALAEPGTVMMITPDGPRGPRMRAHPGIAKLAQRSGCAVLPTAFSARWAWTVPSWDRFLLPLPFGRGAIVYGPPIWPGEASAKDLLARIEEETTAATDLADDLCARPRVAPAPAEG